MTIFVETKFKKKTLQNSYQISDVVVEFFIENENVLNIT